MCGGARSAGPKILPLERWGAVGYGHGGGAHGGGQKNGYDADHDGIDFHLCCELLMPAGW